MESDNLNLPSQDPEMAECDEDWEEEHPVVYVSAEDIARDWAELVGGRYRRATAHFEDREGGIVNVHVIGSSESPSDQPEIYIVSDGRHLGVMNFRCAPLVPVEFDYIELYGWEFGLLQKDGKWGFFVNGDMGSAVDYVFPEFDEVQTEPGLPVRVRMGDVWGYVSVEDECFYSVDEDPEGGWPADLEFFEMPDIALYEGLPLLPARHRDALKGYFLRY